MNDLQKCLDVLMEAFKKIEEVEVDAEDTHYTSIAKAGLKYVMSNLFSAQQGIWRKDEKEEDAINSSCGSKLSSSWGCKCKDKD